MSIVKLFLLDQYDDAKLDRKKVAAMHALFITTPAPTELLDAIEGRDDNDERTIDLQPGQITMLEPGEEVQTSRPGRFRPDLRAVPVPPAALRLCLQRHAQGELLELAAGAPG